MRLAEDNTSWKASSIQRRDFRRTADGPEVTDNRKKRRKNTRRWCKGVEGREHKPALRLTNMAQIWLSRGRTVCAQSSHRSWCDHERYCTECGKIIDYFLPREQCPDPH